MLGLKLGGVRWPGRGDMVGEGTSSLIWIIIFFKIDFLFGANFIFTAKLQRCRVSVYALTSFP